MKWDDNLILESDEKRLLEFVLIYEEEFGPHRFDLADPVRKLWIVQFLREVPDGMLGELVVRTSERIRSMRGNTVNPKPRLNLFREVLALLVKKERVEPEKEKVIDRVSVIKKALEDGIITDPGPCFECGGKRSYMFDDDVSKGTWWCVECQLAKYKSRKKGGV